MAETIGTKLDKIMEKYVKKTDDLNELIKKKQVQIEVLGIEVDELNKQLVELKETQSTEIKQCLKENPSFKDIIFNTTVKTKVSGSRGARLDPKIKSDAIEKIMSVTPIHPDSLGVSDIQKKSGIDPETFKKVWGSVKKKLTKKGDRGDAAWQRSRKN